MNEECLRVVERREHAGDLFGHRRHLFAGRALGGKSRDAHLEARRASNISSRVKPCSAARKLSGSLPRVGGPPVMNVPAP